MNQTQSFSWAQAQSSALQGKRRVKARNHSNVVLLPGLQRKRSRPSAASGLLTSLAALSFRCIASDRIDCHRREIRAWMACSGDAAAFAQRCGVEWAYERKAFNLSSAASIVEKQFLAEGESMVHEGYSPRVAIRSVAFGLMTFAISACAQVDGTAGPLQGAGVTPLETSDPTYSQYLVSSPGGDTVALDEWRPTSQPRAILLAVHGYGDYGSSTFGEAAQEWTDEGLLTYAYDQRGFGRNPSNGDWPGHKALVDDLGEISKLVKKRNPELPFVLIGHSMGGAVVTAAVGEGKVAADRIILLAPALWGGEQLGSILRTMAFAANAVAPDKRWTGDGIVRIQASDNIEMLRGLGRDPLYVRNPSSREFVGLIRLMDRAVNAAPSISAPILVVYGEKDEVVPEESILAVYETIPSEKQFKKIDTGWHMLLRDLEAKKVRDLVAEYARKPTELRSLN